MTTLNPQKTMRINMETLKHDSFPARAGLLKIFSSDLKHALTLLLVLAGASMGWTQQTVTLTANPTRVTIPVNTSGSYTSIVTVTVGNADGIGQVTLSATGAPAGSTPTFDTTVFTNSGSATLIFNYTNVTRGDYDMAIEANGAASYRLPVPVVAGYQWKDPGAAANFTDAANWEGGVAPGAGDTVILPDVTFGDSSTPSIQITADTEIGAVRDIHNGNSTYPNWNIAAGATLSITGDGGYRQLRDTLTSNSRAYVAASGEGTLVVSNANANFDLLVYAENTQNYFLFNALNTLKLDVNRIAIDDIRAYPNYQTNGTTEVNGQPPRRWSPRLFLAKTNLFRATLTDANGWTNAARDYSFVIARNLSGNGTGTDFAMRLGQYNQFDCDSMLWGGSGDQCDSGGGSNPRQIDFDPALTDPILVLRGPNGGRMSNFTLGDAQVENGGTVSQGTKIVADLSGGSVDAMVNALYLGRDADTANGGQGTGRLLLGGGTFDVNNAYLGYQNGPGNGTGVGYCQGRLDVNGTSLFRVNDSLVLGYTAAPGATPFSAETGYGQVYINGGTVEANSITVGGETKVSVENNISVTGAGTLAITNTAGAADANAKIHTLTMTDSTLVLHVDGANTEPYVYVGSLNTSGTSNILRLGSVTGLTSDPQTVKLISYESAAPNFSLELPSGLYGYVENDTVGKTINAVITATAPKNLAWNGNLSGNWDTSSANWQGANSFFNGDSVRFDDSATGPNTTVNIGGALSETVAVGAGGVVVSNDTKSYTFTGTGTIAGTSTMIKEGPGSLTIDGASQLPITINEGAVSVTAQGSSGLATLAAGASLNSAGNINGLVSAGTANNSGTIVANGANITGGTFNNSGTVNGPINVSGGSATNVDTGTIQTAGTSTIGADGVLLNNGLIVNNSGRMTVNGLLMGTGIIQDYDGFNPASPGTGVDGRVAVSGTLSPGDPTTGNPIGTFLVEGRFDLNQNANLIIEVNITGAGADYDVVGCDYWGAIRGNIVMTNIGAMPFAPGQSFLIVSNNFGNLNDQNVNPNADFKFTPPSPGPGMLWDGSNLFTNGIASIKAIPSTPADLMSSVSSNQLTLQWDPSYVGWELQQQIRALTNGISTFATNWTKVNGSDATNEVIININPNNPAAFYRLAHPQFN